MSFRLPFALAAAALLSACGSEPAKQSEPPVAPVEDGNAASPPADVPVVAAATPAADAQPPAFAQCAACHSVAKGGPAMIGPNLWGVAGADAASRPGFAYSDKLKAAGLHWDAATLDKWLSGPMALVPGTKMTFAGQPDPAKRQAIIAYLQRLR